MTDEFVTQALQQDRYLKAIELLDRFDTEIEQIQKHAGQRIIEENPELFVDNPTPKFKKLRDPRTTFAFARTDFKMSRVDSEGPNSDQLKMSLMLHWNDPSVLGHDVDGALAVASLRIKNLQQADFRAVRDELSEADGDTSEAGGTDLQFGADPFDNSPGLIYTPVKTKQDIDRANEQFAAHFRAHGSTYGTPQSDESKSSGPSGE